MMLVCLYKSQSQSLIVKHLTLHTLQKNLCLSTPIFHSYSYTTKTIIPTNVNSLEFRISFLENKCGLSGKALIKASKYLKFDSSNQRPDSVINLFRTFGFTLPNIARIISWCPLILQTYNPEKVIKPKLDFLLSVNLSQEQVVAIVTKNPIILTRSLNNHIIPFLNLLKSVTGCYPSALAVLKCNPFVLSNNISKSFSLNTQFLLELGVPHSQILKLLGRYHILGKSHDEFRKVVLKLKYMGLDLSSSYFLKALKALAFPKDSTWESRCALLRSFGFSNHQILSMFKNRPEVMCYNEKLLNDKMEFFLNKLQWTPLRLSSNPAVLCYSLENRTISRCSVLQVLVSKNSTGEGYMLSTILAMTERVFLKVFVTAHKDDVPEVMEAYQGKVRFDKYTFKQKGQLSLKPS